MLRPTSWDDTPGPPIDPRLLLELMWHVGAQAHDRDGTGSVERAHIPRRTDAEVNAHLDHLASLGLITGRAVPGYRRRVCALTDAGRAWGEEHHFTLWYGDY